MALRTILFRCALIWAGIMLLEKQISSSPADTEVPSAKRAKGNAPSAATVTWVELARYEWVELAR